jgi:DNA-binding protein H-NS
MATLKVLRSKIAKLQLQADAMEKRQLLSVIAQIHSLMHDHGLTVEDVGAKFVAKTSESNKLPKGLFQKDAATVKFRDPKTGATWSGHGRAPGWIATAKNRDRFLVDGKSGSAPVAVKKAVKQGNYVRGVQPAKYRDPKSGAEWSGRGKAPSWLAGARDRTRFLIANAQTSTAKGTSATTKPAAKKIGKKKGKSTPVSQKARVGSKAVTRQATVE